MTGWFTDGDGNRYYLNPVDDGTLGMMRTGWQVIDGKSYYFNTQSDGHHGTPLRGHRHAGRLPGGGRTAMIQ